MTENRTNIDGSVASVVLVRAALMLGEWQTAISAASDVIAAYPDLFDETEYTTIGFDLLDKETIFGHEYSSNTSKAQSSFTAWMNIYGERLQRFAANLLDGGRPAPVRPASRNGLPEEEFRQLTVRLRLSCFRAACHGRKIRPDEVRHHDHSRPNGL
jgi:hypothetical protein